ncbi:hypothetical protein GCM10019071_31580 [Sphingobium fuliginis]|uniref:Secreted protein n=1 Tax=Sphingobium fuliginis (strain ATCC 27551) TaxID=336203 RepID=A0ABQ1F3E3_SPHSA|nr:hypothetical protein GCM10019071_31580 [Sphingobium fuliginis]
MRPVIRCAVWLCFSRRPDAPGSGNADPLWVGCGGGPVNPGGAELPRQDGSTIIISEAPPRKTILNSLRPVPNLARGGRRRKEERIGRKEASPCPSPIFKAPSKWPIIPSWNLK